MASPIRRLAAWPTIISSRAFKHPPTSLAGRNLNINTVCFPVRVFSESTSRRIAVGELTSELEFEV